MRAKVRPVCKQNMITSCGGKHFVKSEWLAVPIGREDEALENPFLMVEEIPDPDAKENTFKPVYEIPEEEVEEEVEEVIEDINYNITDKAYELATKEKIDLSEIVGSGSGGKITVPDIRKAIKEK